MSGTTLLEAEGVTKSFWIGGGFGVSATENRAVDKVSIRLAEGEILGLVGESGCGKSTLAKLLLGLEHADAGTVRLDGQTLFGDASATVPAARRGIQMVFQDPFGSLNPRMRVRDLVGEGLRIRGRPRAEIDEEVLRHLELVGLGPDAMTKYAHQFSGGQRQRLCIARAIILKPKLLIADEAASALDVSVQMQILNLLLDIRDNLGLSIIFISHDMGVIEYLCDRVAVMYRGRIVEENTTAALIDAPRHPYTAHLIAARPRLHAAARIRVEDVSVAEVADASGSAGNACNYSGQCPRAGDDCRRRAPALEGSGVARIACFHPLQPDEQGLASDVVEGG